LAIIAVFLAYLRQFLIDLHQIYRHSGVPKTRLRAFFSFLAQAVSEFLERHNVLTNVQTGFRKNRSTIDQIIRLQDTINRSLRNHSHTLGVFLDFEKAFDMMWRSGFMIKLKKYGINSHMYDWIKEFLFDRTIQVRVGNALSKVHFAAYIFFGQTSILKSERSSINATSIVSYIIYL